MKNLLGPDQEELFVERGGFSDEMNEAYREQAVAARERFEKQTAADVDLSFALEFKLTGIDGQKFEDMDNLTAREEAQVEACLRFNSFASHYGLYDSENVVYETEIFSMRDLAYTVSLKDFTKKQRKKIRKGIKQRLLEESGIIGRVDDFYYLTDIAVMGDEAVKQRYRHHQNLELFGLEENVMYSLKKSPDLQTGLQAQ
ncbi:hypothetical protein [Saccharibacillus deserti]|uniref:hypothetical protein n=1 Tax=Saccharibacillus deserti TaxID=1634444 RepID=UPI001554CA3E|nr:hypothetical protein [Saccharibacillus deserti]